MQQWTKTQFLGWRENWLNIWLSYSTLVRLGMIKIIFAEYTWLYLLTHWGRVTHICVIKLTIIGSVNGLAPERRLAIIWTNGGILSIGPLGTNFNEILIKIHTFSQENAFENVVCETAAILSRPQCVKHVLPLKVLLHCGTHHLRWPGIHRQEDCKCPVAINNHNADPAVIHKS